MEKSLWRRFRNYFLTGLVIWLPLVVTVYVLKVIFDTVDSLLGGIIYRFLPVSIPGLGAIATIVLITFTGLVATNYFGRRFIAWGESLLTSIPVVKSIYTTTKQIIEAFTPSDQEAFKRVGLIQFPHPGMYALVFIAGEARGELGKAVGKEALTVFLPTTPNPTTGYLLVLPKEDVLPVDISVENALKLIISAGFLESGTKKLGRKASQVKDE